MTAPSSSEAPAAPSALTPLTANRAILTYVVGAFGGQLLVGALLPSRIGLALLTGGVLSLVLFTLLFRPALREFTATPRWRTAPDVLTALGAFGLGFVASRGLAVFMQAVLPGSSEALQNYNLQFSSSGPDLWLLLFAGGLFIPFVEELVFRGFGLAGYEKYRGVLSGALLTSLLFALVHGVPAQAIAVFPLGLVIARAVQFTRSFWTGVIIHALNNSLSLGAAALLLGNETFSDLLQGGAASNVRIGLGAGFAGLLIGGLALFGAFSWLRVRGVPALQRGPVWSASLVVPILLFVLAAIGTGLGDLLRPLLPTS
ncbi:CPBP family intramembrane glutamic endopeptidase [Deinococcus yavapaiensis]|uniref:CAAX prenyl protease 2/Lysostaphin resistance protein A-like domain-containing protein n=1 Tax=Deinococcus yavapaiensis KR-236 TaxID=694435 RepID=A0A318SA10_9DEIO|nr:type II CAAX endopeptidase family protein [Deinococcus yavapaiensis]PYE55709.1 hypothetical protein DES52_10272 [Deinococcus yavapaiensis KR-236]